MSASGINRKIVEQYIVDGRELGKADQELYNELSQRYADKKKLALLISGKANKIEKEKYSIWSNILIVLAILLILDVVFATIQFFILFNLEPIMLLGLWKPVFIISACVFGLIEIRKDNVTGYLLVGGAALMSVPSSHSFNGTIGNLMNVGLALAIIVIVGYLYKNMFPKFGPFGLKPGSNGDYEL